MYFRHSFLSSRRAEERALKKPKQAALNFFFIMIPLATTLFDTGGSKQNEKKSSETGLTRLTTEQKRKVIKSVTMKDGPRPKQLIIISFIWIFSTFLGLEQIFALKMQEKGSLAREYWVKPFENSSREISIIKDEDTMFCTVWNEPESIHGFVVWILFVVIPIVIGPVFCTFMEILHSLVKKCSRHDQPATPSQFRSWVTIHLMSMVTMTTYTLHLWLVETHVSRQFGLDYFSSLMLKYFFGNIDIILIPMIAIFVDGKLREGVGLMFTAKKRGLLSKTNSVYSEYM